MEAIFIDPRMEEECPVSLAKCPYDSSATKVQCVEDPARDCPILEILAISVDLKTDEKYRSYRSVGPSFNQSASLEYQLSYSKTQTSGELAAIVFTAVRSKESCSIGPDQDRLLGKDAM